MNKPEAETENRPPVFQRLFIGGILIVFIVSIILMYYGRLTNEKRDNLMRGTEVSAVKTADEFEKYLALNYYAIELSAYSLDDMIRRKKPTKEMQQYLVDQSTAIRTAVSENSTGLYACINGKFLSGTNWTPPEDFVVEERPWYIHPMEGSGELILSGPYIDAQSEKRMLALGKTLCDGKSVVSVDISLGWLQRLVEDAVESDSADMQMLLNEEGTVVAHSDSGELAKEYKKDEGNIGEELFKGIGNASGESFDFEYKGSHYVACAKKLDNGWYSIAVKDATKVFSGMRNLLGVTIAVIVVVIALVSVGLTHFRRSNRKNPDKEGQSGENYSENNKI